MEDTAGAFFSEDTFGTACEMALRPVAGNFRKLVDDKQVTFVILGGQSPNNSRVRA
jgi:hypothetical protein